MLINFSLDSVLITNPRSLNKDTDYASVSISYNGGPPAIATQAMGDVGDGTYPIGLGVQADIPPGDQIFVSLTSLGNAGIQAGIKAYGKDMASAIGGILGTVAVPVLGSALGALAGFVVGEVGAILFADCDGTVAAGIYVFSANDLIAQTANNKSIRNGVTHPGTDSPTGCGANSKYATNTTITTVATITPIFALGGKYAAGGVTGPVISVSGNHISVDMSAYHRPNAYGTIVNPTQVAITFPDASSYTGTLVAPGTINFNNNSSWTKVAAPVIVVGAPPIMAPIGGGPGHSPGTPVLSQKVETAATPREGDGWGTGPNPALLQPVIEVPNESAAGGTAVAVAGVTR
jgi:hypothetical protein